MLIRLLLGCMLLSFFGISPPTTCLAIEPGEGYIATSDGVRLFYRTVGSGSEILVVVHGGPGNSMDSLLPDMEPLAQNRTVIYYDQRGNGRSDLLRDPEKLSIAKHVADLETVRRHFNLNRMNLLGNSWGGLLAGFYAIAHPDHINKIVLHSPASPSFKLLSDSTGYIYQRIPEASKRRFVIVSAPNKWTSSPDPLKLCQEFYDILKPVYFSTLSKADAMKGDTCAGSVAALRVQQIVNKLIWNSLGEWDIQPALRDVHIPTLVIHGSDDMIPADSSRAWAAALPEARLLIIEETGHMTHIEQPAIFFSAVNKFLAGEWPQDAKVVQEEKGKDSADHTKLVESRKEEKSQNRGKQQGAKPAGVS